jgi:hypothetical protein
MRLVHLTIPDAHVLAQVLNEVVNAIPDDVLAREVRERESELDQLWERLRAVDSPISLTEDEAALAAAAVDDVLRILSENEFATRTGVEASDGRRLAALLRV